MSLDTTIAALQSRITKRGQDIADLEGLYSYQRAVSYTRRQWKLAQAIREEIRPLAEEQKLDRRVFRTLTDQRTKQHRFGGNLFIDLETFPILRLLGVEQTNQVGDIRQSNKFTFG